jgi:uncharacterized protein with HEPN domain
VTQDWQRLADYLAHIAQAIERTAAYTRGLDQGGFMTSTLVQDAVIRNIEIIGEASRNIEQRFPAFAASHPALPLAVAYQMRNAVAHGYFKVDFDIVWKTVQRDLPVLLAQVQALLAQLQGPDGLADAG